MKTVAPPEMGIGEELKHVGDTAERPCAHITGDGQVAGPGDDIEAVGAGIWARETLVTIQAVITDNTQLVAAYITDKAYQLRHLAPPRRGCGRELHLHNRA